MVENTSIILKFLEILTIKLMVGAVFLLHFLNERFLKWCTFTTMPKNLSFILFLERHLTNEEERKEIFSRMEMFIIS